MYIDLFASEAHRVLRRDGSLFVHLLHQSLEQDQFAVHDLIKERFQIDAQILHAGFVHAVPPLTERNYAGMLMHKYVYRRVQREQSSPPVRAHTQPQQLRAGGRPHRIAHHHQAREDATLPQMHAPMPRHPVVGHSTSPQISPRADHGRTTTAAACTVSSSNSTLLARLPHGLWSDAFLPAYLGPHHDSSGPGGGLARTFSRLRAAAAARLRLFGEERAARLFERLRGAGLEAGPLGVDLTEVVRRRHASRHALAPLEDADIADALRLLVDQTPLERAFTRCDLPAMRNRCSASDGSRPDGLPRARQSRQSRVSAWLSAASTRRARHPSRSLDAAAAGLLESLQSRGYALVDDFNDFGLDVAALEAQAAAALNLSARRAQHASASFGGRMLGKIGVLKAEEPLPALEPLLTNASLAALMRAYLGGPVRYDGEDALHYPPRMRHPLAKRPALGRRGGGQPPLPAASAASHLSASTKS